MPDLRWTDLFDPAGVEHIVELVRGDFRAQHLGGYKPTLHGPLRSITLAALDEYFVACGGVKADGELAFNRDDVRAAFELYTWVEDLAVRVSEREIASDDGDQLKRRWLKFIAYGAGHRIYDDVPKETATSASGGRRSGEARRSRNVDRDRRIHDARNAGASQKKIAIDESVDESTVTRVLKKPRP